MINDQLRSKQYIKTFFSLNLQNLPNGIGWVGFDDYGSNWEAAVSLFSTYSMSVD